MNCLPFPLFLAMSDRAAIVAQCNETLPGWHNFSLVVTVQDHSAAAQRGDTPRKQQEY